MLIDLNWCWIGSTFQQGTCAENIFSKKNHLLLVDSEVQKQKSNYIFKSILIFESNLCKINKILKIVVKAILL